MPTPRWDELASPELDQAGEVFDVGLLPLGAIEQHGPHLPTGTDAFVASAICEAAASRARCVVLPTISVGCSYGHGTTLPGTLSISPELLSLVVHDVIAWAAHSGLFRVIILNAHVGNAPALAIATDHLRLERPDLRVGTREWWKLDAELEAEMFLDGSDIHANRAETSLMLAIAPELVHLDRIKDADDPDRTQELVFRYTAERLSTHGVTGRPSEATPELGARLLSDAAESLAALIQRARVERPPLGESQSARGADHFGIGE